MLFISIVFTLFSIQCKKYLNGTHDQVSPPNKQSHSGGTGADYQNQPPTPPTNCMPGYPCCGICSVCPVSPVSECSNRVNTNRRKEQQKGTLCLYVLQLNDKGLQYMPSLSQFDLLH